MDRIKRHFQNLPSQETVARMFLKYGISVRDGSAFCGSIEQSDTALARAIGVDRRVVRSTINRIMTVPDLLKIYSKLQSMLLLSDAAAELGCSCIEIVPTDARMPGIMAGIINVLSDAGISIRQAVVSDPQDETGSHLIIVTDGEMPGDLMTEIRKCRGVDSVILR